MVSPKALWTCLFFLLSALPFSQTMWRYLPDVKAHGAEARVRYPRYSFQGFWNGTFQEQFERWLGTKIGFRGIFVRSDNQINLSVFHQFSSNSRFQVVLGKDRYLYGRGYVSTYMSPKLMTESQRVETVRRLKRVQKELHARNKGFLLLISPSKATLYEEYLPEESRRRKKPVPSNYELMMPLLRQAKINVLDSVSMLRDLKSKGVTAFSRGSTHWTFSSSCLVAAEVMRQFEAQTGEKYPPMPCAPLKQRGTPIAQDMDLATLSNLWFPETFGEPLSYAKPEPSTLGATKIPTMASVGSSFMWSILHYLDAYKMYQDRNFYYYFNTRYSYPSGQVQSVARKSFDFDNEILSKDLLLLEVNESVIHSVGFGSLPRLVKHLASAQKR